LRIVLICKTRDVSKNRIAGGSTYNSRSEPPMLETGTRGIASQLTVVNWFAELRCRAPAR
jgi:hypothetical protein